MRAALVLLAIAAALHADDDRRAIPVKDPVLRKRIGVAIGRGVAYLKASQRAGGYWNGPENEENRGGSKCHLAS